MLNLLRKVIRVIKREIGFSGSVQRTFPINNCRRKVSPVRSAGYTALRVVAVLAFGRLPLAAAKGVAESPRRRTR